MFEKEVFLFLFLWSLSSCLSPFAKFSLPQVEFKGRLRPGKMLLVDFAEAGAELERFAEQVLL